MKKITLILLAILYMQSSCSDNRGYRVKVGEKAPQMQLTLLDGSTISNEDLKGKVVVLQFTASWCSVCREEMPHLEKEVWQQFKKDNFIIIGIDLKEKKDKILPFIKQTGITYPVAMDSDGSVFEKYTLPKAGVTRNIVLDKDGKIIFLSRLYERKEFEEMIEVIKKELKKDM